MHWRSSYWVIEQNLMGMQAYSAIGIGTCGAILEVPLDMHPASGQLGSDLMMASSKQIDVIKNISFRLPYLPVFQPCFLKIRGPDSPHRRFTLIRSGIVGETLVLYGIPKDEVPQFPAFLRKSLVCNGPVVFLDLARAEHLRESAQGLVGPGEYHDAAGGPVQPVRQTQKHVARLVVLHLQIMFDIVGKRDVPGLVRLDYLPGELVHEYQVIVLVEDPG